MRGSLLASFGLSAAWCPVLAADDPTGGWGQFGILGILLFSAIGIIKRFMERSLDQQEKQTSATITQQEAQTTVLLGISDEIRQARLATAALDARISKHMDDDENRAGELLEALRRLGGHPK